MVGVAAALVVPSYVLLLVCAVTVIGRVVMFAVVVPDPEVS